MGQPDSNRRHRLKGSVFYHIEEYNPKVNQAGWQPAAAAGG
jgi:hypothetical protein